MPARSHRVAGGVAAGMRAPGWGAPGRLITVRLEGPEAPLDGAAAFDTEPGFRVLTGGWLGGSTVIAVNPLHRIDAGDDPFQALDPGVSVGPPSGPRGAVGGGWIGRFGYPLGGRIETIAPHPRRVAGAADHDLAWFDHVVRFDRRDRTWWFEALWSPERERVLEDRLRWCRQRLASRPETRPAGRPGRFTSRLGARHHMAAVARCREHIRAGDVYQVNVCLSVEAPWTGDAFAAFRAAQAGLEAPYAAFLGDPGREVLSFSPELFLRRRGREVSSRPIKGTGRRAGGAAAAARAARALEASEKDRAENVMIVDLMRNDLGRVCGPGSVEVPALCRVEPHPGVWHLVSEVRGVLQPAATDGDLLRATFPPGSVTGAPKIRAMQLIRELEDRPREAYTGAIGLISPVAGLELSVAIRTFEIDGDRIRLGVGGGVVADSDPAAEYDECMAKAEPLVAALGGRLEAAR